MKQTTILLTIIVFITLQACKQEKGNKNKISGGGPQSSLNKKDSIPRVTALQMIQHYRTHYLDSTLIGRSDQDTASITLFNSDLNKFYDIDDITRIRFLSAAYLPSNPDSSIRNKVTVLIQLKQGNNSNYFYYDAQLFQAICPPPPGCGVEN